MTPYHDFQWCAKHFLQVKQPFSSRSPPWPSFPIWKSTNERFSKRKWRGMDVLHRNWPELESACSGPAGRARWGPGIGHGRELFPYGTSSHTHGYAIDFINPDCHLLGKNERMRAFGMHEINFLGNVYAKSIADHQRQVIANDATKASNSEDTLIEKRKLGGQKMCLDALDAFIKILIIGIHPFPKNNRTPDKRMS